MSAWGGVDARFTFQKDHHEFWTDGHAKMIMSQFPGGSEWEKDELPEKYTYEDGDTQLLLRGRMRDVEDHNHAARMLGWFVFVCDLYWFPSAEIEWEYDGGPRYRYEWHKGTLTKLRGVLDS